MGRLSSSLRSTLRTLARRRALPTRTRTERRSIIGARLSLATLRALGPAVRRGPCISTYSNERGAQKETPTLSDHHRSQRSLTARRDVGGLG